MWWRRVDDVRGQRSFDVRRARPRDVEVEVECGREGGERM